MSIIWDAYRPEVIQLYVEENKTAEQTVKYLNDTHGIDITVRQFKTQYGNLKNLQAKEWQAVFQEVRKRKAEGKDSEVCLFGRRLDPSRVKRARRRYDKGAEGENSANTFNENRLDVRTPISHSEEPAVEADSDERHLYLERQQSHEFFGLQGPPGNLSHGDLVFASLFGETSSVEANRNKELSRVSASHDHINIQQPDQMDHSTGGSSLNANFLAHLQDSSSSFDLQHVVNFADRASNSFFSQSPGPIQNAISPAYQDYDCIWQQQGKTLSPCHNVSFGIVPCTSNGVLGCLSPHSGSFWASEAISEIFIKIQADRVFHTSTGSRLTRAGNLGETEQFVARMDPALHVLRPIATIIDIITFDRPKLDMLSRLKIDENTVHQIFALLAYLASNAYLQHDQLMNFIEWVFTFGHAGSLSTFLQRCSSGVPGVRVLIVKILEGISTNTDGGYRFPKTFNFFKTQPHVAFNLLLAADRRAFSGSLGTRLLIQATNANHLKAVKLLIDRGANVNGVGRIPTVSSAALWTPLSRAAINGSEELIRFLIQHGAKVNRRIAPFDGKCVTALELAVEFERAEAVAALLVETATADPVQDGSESIIDPSLLVNAAEEGRESFLRFLQTENIVEDEVLECALYHAVVQSNVQALTTLLCLGVDPNARKYRLSPTAVLDTASSDGSTCDNCGRIHLEIPDDGIFRTAVDHGHIDDEMDEREFDSTNPILLALEHYLGDGDSGDSWRKKSCDDDFLKNNDEYMVYLLAKAGARFSLDALNRRGIRVDVAFCQVLSDIGRDVSLIGVDLLEDEARKGHLSLCAALLRMGVPIDAYGRGSLSGLQAAAGEGNRTLIQYFLDRGADINLPAHEHRGRTVLQAAAIRGDSELLDFLLNAGADIRAPPAKKYGESVLERVAKSLVWSRGNGRADFFRKLLQLGAEINRPEPESDILGQLILRGDIECLKVAIQAGARIEDMELDSGWRPRRTALQVAARALNEEAIQLLLDHGARVNALSGDHSRVTALQCTLGVSCSRSDQPQRRFRIVKLLLSNGANINSPAGSADGRTALQDAVSCEKPDLDIIRLLLEGGADVNAEPSRVRGITALQGAAIKGEIHVARMLLDHGAEINAAAAPVQGRTAIEGAAEHGRLDMVNFLLHMGATPDPVTGFSRAIDLAEKENHWEIVDLLKESQDTSNALAIIMQ